MNRIAPVLLALILSFGCVHKEKHTVSEIAENPAALAVKGEGEWWMERHQTILSRLTKDPELILIGNSIFHSLDNENRQEVWEQYLDQYQAVNMGILPYGYKPNHRNNINKATNSLISKFPEKNPNIHYTDIGHIYQDTEGKVRQELMPDYLHPNPEGHLLMFEALEDEITGMMVE